MTHLKKGDKAPAIDADDHKGNNIKLGNYKGKNQVAYTTNS